LRAQFQTSIVIAFCWVWWKWLSSS